MGNNHLLDIERPYVENDPLDMDDAREASRRVAKLRRRAEATLRSAVEDAADKEAIWHKARAEAILKLRQEHSATIVGKLADGEGQVIKALVDFRVAEGMVDAAKERLRGIEGERSQLRGLMDFSAGVRAALREQPDRQATQTIGGRRAA